MKHYLSILIALFSVQIYAQEAIRFTVVDSETNDPIKNVYAFTKLAHTTSKSNGSIALEFALNSTIHLSHVSYRDTSFISSPELFPDTIFLRRETQVLKRVEVSDKPYAVFKPDKCHVFDYEFYGDTLLVLTYEREKMLRKVNEQSKSLFHDCELLVISPNGKVLFTRKLIDEIIGFHRDPMGRIYVLSNSAVFSVQLGSQLKLTPIGHDEFEEQIKPLKAAIDNNYIVDNYRWHYPEFSYFSFHSESDSLIHVRTVKDDFTMELFRSEYKYMNNRDKLWAYRKELETGVDKEVISAYKTGFQSTLYYQSLYAPVFKADSVIVIFDHHSQFIYTHSLNNSFKDSVALGYMDLGRLKFDEHILKDRKKGLFYSVFKRGSHRYLGRINIVSGGIREITELYYPFPENIKLRNGTAYYLYRKPESKNFTYLFAESVE